MKIIISLFLFLFTNIQFAQNVIIVVIDGARYTETFGGGNTFIPHLYDDLRPSGYLYTNFRIADDGITSTNPGHASILTGTWQLIANNGSERPDKPTVFEYFRQQLISGFTDNYVIAGKSKLNVVSYSTAAGYGSPFGASTSCATLTDDLVYTNLIEIMNNDQPRLLIVNFPDTDVKGHTGVWDDYISALTNADNLVYQLWQHIQAGDYGYNTTNTTMFVTNDHGRHDDTHGGFTNHGDDCEGCEHIMLLALGKNITPGVENSDLHYQIDIAPTVGDLLGFSTSQAVGVTLFEGSNPLPVELASFSAVVLDKGVKLIWKTETEVNNYGFEIERTPPFPSPYQGEGGEAGRGWEKIGFVQGNGNSNSPKDYSFLDSDLLAGKYQYRLKQIDTDGQSEYSKVIEVDLGSVQKFELSQNYPNPFNPSTTISFTLPQSGNVTLKIYNTIGEQVAELVNAYKEAGIYSINFDASKLNSGVYIYQISSINLAQTKKMMLIK